jgi:hypothetical protein
MTRIAPLLAAAALAGCSTAPGTGWSRASDLSVYGAMTVYARAALDQEVLCAGFTPASTAADWAREFGARQEAVTEAMNRRYGGQALARARATWAPSVACRELPDHRWRQRYARQLRLLEIRLQMADGREG